MKGNSLLVDVLLVLALPGEVVLLMSTDVEGDKEADSQYEAFGVSLCARSSRGRREPTSTKYGRAGEGRSGIRDIRRAVVSPLKRDLVFVELGLRGCR